MTKWVQYCFKLILMLKAKLCTQEQCQQLLFEKGPLSTRIPHHFCYCTLFLNKHLVTLHFTFRILPAVEIFFAYLKVTKHTSLHKKYVPERILICIFMSVCWLHTVQKSRTFNNGNLAFNRELLFQQSAEQKSCMKKKSTHMQYLLRTRVYKMYPPTLTLLICPFESGALYTLGNLEISWWQ